MLGIMASENSVPASIVYQLMRYLDSRSLDSANILAQENIDSKQLAYPEARISETQYMRLYARAFSLAEDSHFGLHLGECVELTSYSVLGYMIMNCVTLGEAIGKIEKYEKVVGHMQRTQLALDNGDIKAVYAGKSTQGEDGRHYIEGLFSSIICFLRKTGLDGLNPLEVGFTHQAHPAITEYKRIFRCPVYFGRNENYYIIARDDLEYTFPDPNPSLFRHFVNYIEDMISSQQKQSTYSARIKELILANLNTAIPSLAGISGTLGLSTRSLQLKLKQEGTTFRDLVESLRLELSLQCFKNGNSVDEISFLLGYSDASAFCHAFRRWTGKTPTDYRSELLSG